MTPVEVQKYHQLKADLFEVPEDLVASFVRFGSILREIRDQRLYLVEFSSFEEFCLKTLDRGRDNINKLIAGTDVVQGLIESGMIGGMPVIDLPNNEAARMLGRIPREQRREILERANEHARRAGRDETTSKDIEEAGLAKHHQNRGQIHR
jgi:hypothetical protein